MSPSRLSLPPLPRSASEVESPAQRVSACTACGTVAGRGHAGDRQGDRHRVAPRGVSEAVHSGRVRRACDAGERVEHAVGIVGVGAIGVDRQLGAGWESDLATYVGAASVDRRDREGRTVYIGVVRQHGGRRERAVFRHDRVVADRDRGVVDAGHGEVSHAVTVSPAGSSTV